MAEIKQPRHTEWPGVPPLEPGKGEELRHIAGPGDDIVFEANHHARRTSEAKRAKIAPRSADDDTARMDDDALHSRTER